MRYNKTHMFYKRANNFLLIGIIGVTSYIIVSPFSPALISWWQLNHSDKPRVLERRVADQAKQSTINKANSVTIPSMGFEGSINEAPYAQRYEALDQGIWHNPRTSTPDKGGNTVIAGHRFTYTNPRGAFYDLNRVEVGDRIGVVWNNKPYTYIVRETRVVGPNDGYIENATENAQLTLFTCTPLWNPTDRLVVIADLTEQAS